MTELRTARLLLRRWRDGDLEPFAALNADAEVMRFFPSAATKAVSDASAERHAAALDQRGWGLWAVEVPGVAEFIGFVGLLEQTFAAHFTPAVEIGWRLARPHWGKGYAPEGAAAVLDLALDPSSRGIGLGLEEVVSMTSVDNAPSRRVMEKLGMTRDPAEDFEHPNVPEGHRLRPHVLYRITAEEWRDLKRTNRPGRAPVGTPSA